MGCITCKSTRRIPKGVIHVQATFNNTIVTVTDIRGRVVSWASAGTSGFKGTRRGSFDTFKPKAGNAISYSSRSRYATSRSHDKGPGSLEEMHMSYS
ncbi:hypothetical protein Leryth_026753 [Lithospermum erythrorhizon]|nr:hypothetical protein Leryth_026753 [Lithospermum erythrorhizon]